MRPDLVRKTVSSDWTPFTFVNDQRYFFVKNLSKQPCYVAFEENALESEAIKVSGETAEEVAVSYSKFYDSRQLRQNTLWIKGNGEIEVQGMEIWVE